MDVLYQTQPVEVRGFEQTAEARAAKREHLRGRNNVTLCRSPTRDFDPKRIKNELKEKRQQEYLKRRSVSPQLCEAGSTRTKGSPRTASSVKPLGDQMFANAIPANGHKKVVSTSGACATDGSSSSSSSSSSSTWASSWTEQAASEKQENQCESEQPASTSTTAMKDLNQSRTETMSGDKVPAPSLSREDQRAGSHQTTAHTTTAISTCQEAGVQTVPGLVTVRESDIQQLADYLQEALMREEAVKKKLLALQQSTSNLMNSSDTVWTARCSEDLLRSKIKALETQLQLCLQKIPKDGLKKLVMQMEKQKVMYEEKALLALQKITREKTDVLSQAESLQESIITAKAESLKWQNLHQELKLSFEQLRENQHLSSEQLQQLHRQVELSRSREDEMRDEAVSLRRANEELQYNMGLLEEDNQSLKEEIQNLRDDDSETSLNENKQLTQTRDFQVDGRLRHAQERLRLKEEECDELQTVLHTLEEECRSTQARLSQCRDELRQVSQRRSSRPTHCCPRWTLCISFLLLFLALVGFFLLWLWHPPFREQIFDLYSDVEARIEDFVLETSSPRHSGCFRPI